MRQLLTTACPLDCPDGCSLEVTVDDGRITRIDADTGPGANPFTQGFICQKVKHQAERVYSPDRVLTPLIRTGTKGSGTFRAASWDEAVNLVASRIEASIREHGADSVVAYLYSSSAGLLASEGLGPMLFERLGCPDVKHTICAATASAAWKQVYGRMHSADPFDLDHSQLIVIWGANPNSANTHLTPLINKAVKANGAKLVVVDPRRTGAAAKADLHLPIRPGTDAVLAYAVTRWLSQHGAHALDFIAAHVEGADAFIAAADEWTLERAAEECGVEAEQIEAFAALLSASSPAMLRIGWGLERNRNGGSGCLGVLSMWAVAGKFGARGSGIIRSTSSAAPVDVARLRSQGIGVGSGEIDAGTEFVRSSLSMNDVGLALHGADVGAGPHAEARPWPLARVLFVQGANPVATAMNQGEFISGLERDDLFTVVHDQVLTDTALYADVVLPATTHFEAADLMASYGSFSLQRINPVIARVGESRSNDEVASAIAAALGLTGSEFDPDPERMAAIVLTSGMNGSSASVRPVGTTVQFVDTYPSFTGSTGSTASGRARLHDPASELPLPFYVAPGREGLTLLTPSSNRTINSMFAEFDPPEAAVSVHPVDAAARGIEDGDVVRAFNDLGEIRLLARVDGRVRPGVVSIPKGFWRRQFDNGHTANVLIPRGVNDLASGACFNDARIEIERCIR